MKLRLDYDELNAIVKCYVQRVLNMEAVSDIEIAAASEEYSQAVTCELLVRYQSDSCE